MATEPSERMPVSASENEKASSCQAIAERAARHGDPSLGGLAGTDLYFRDASLNDSNLE